MIVDPGIPTDWPALIRSFELLWRDAAGDPRRITRSLDDSLEDENDFVSEFCAQGGMLAEAVVLLGPHECAPAFAACAPYQPMAIRAARSRLTEDARASLAVLYYFAAAQVSGDTLAPAGVSALRTWPARLARERKQLSPVAREALALAALAVGQSNVVPGLVGGGALPKKLSPGKRFAFDTPQFVRYLATACSAGASFDAIAPAWESHLLSFPHKLAATNLFDRVHRWAALIFAARTTLGALGGLPDVEVAEALHRQLSSVPARTPG